VDLLNRPNILMAKLDPPLAMLSALWFYMTPQPPKVVPFAICHCKNRTAGKLTLSLRSNNLAFHARRHDGFHFLIP
jgi:hypothetical protein